MGQRLDRRKTVGGRVFKQPRNQVDSIRGRLAENLDYSLVNTKSPQREHSWGTDLGEGVRLDLRELVLHVVRVHGADLFPCRRSQNLDDLNELIDSGFSGKERLAQHQFGHHATG